MITLYKVINNTIRGEHLSNGIITPPPEVVGASFAASLESCVLWAQLMRHTLTKSKLLDEGWALPDAMYYIAKVEVEDSTPVLVCKNAMHTDKAEWEVSTAAEAVELLTMPGEESYAGEVRLLSPVEVKEVIKVSAEESYVIYDAYADMASDPDPLFDPYYDDEYEDEEEDEVPLKELLEDRVTIFPASLEEAGELVKAPYMPLIVAGQWGDVINGKFYTPKDSNTLLVDELLAYILQGEVDGETPFKLWRANSSMERPSFKDTMVWLLGDNPEYLFSYGSEIYGTDYKKHYTNVVESIVSAVDSLFHINDESFGKFLYNLQGLTRDFRRLIWEWLSGNRDDAGTYISSDVKKLFNSIIGTVRGDDVYRLTVTNSRNDEYSMLIDSTLSSGIVHKSAHEDMVNWYVSIMDKYMPVEVYVGPNAGDKIAVPYSCNEFFNPKELYELLEANQDSE